MIAFVNRSILFWKSSSFFFVENLTIFLVFLSVTSCPARRGSLASSAPNRRDAETIAAQPRRCEPLRPRSYRHYRLTRVAKGSGVRSAALLLPVWTRPENRLCIAKYFQELDSRPIDTKTLFHTGPLMEQKYSKTEWTINNLLTFGRYTLWPAYDHWMKSFLIKNSGVHSPASLWVKQR